MNVSGDLTKFVFMYLEVALQACSHPYSPRKSLDRRKPLGLQCVCLFPYSSPSWQELFNTFSDGWSITLNLSGYLDGDDSGHGQ